MKLAVQSMNGKTALGMEMASVTTKKQNGIGNVLQNRKRSSSTKKKALNYNSREISSQLMRASKSRNASNVLGKAKSKLAQLQRCKGSGQYNEGEVEVAIAHAKRMVKCAQLKYGNLKQEEALKKSYERKETSDRLQKKNEIKRREFLRKRRAHRDEERNKIMEAELKYQHDKFNHSQGTAEYAAVSLELSATAMNMSELQLSEHAIELLETQMGVEAGSMGATVEMASTGAAVDVCV